MGPEKAAYRGGCRTAASVSIPVQRQKVRDRAAGVPEDRKIRFGSSILPRWARRSRSLDALLPVLYLRGVSAGG